MNSLEMLAGGLDVDLEKYEFLLAFKHDLLRLILDNGLHFTERDRSRKILLSRFDTAFEDYIEVRFGALRGAVPDKYSMLLTSNGFRYCGVDAGGGRSSGRYMFQNPNTGNHHWVEAFKAPSPEIP